MEQHVARIKQSVKEAQDRHKSYVYKERTCREFKFGYKVFLKVKGRKISLILWNSKKLAAIFHGPFEVLNRTGPVAYELWLTPSLKIHNVFHIFMLNKYVYNYDHVLDWFMI